MKKQYSDVIIDIINHNNDVITESRELPFDSTEQEFNW